MNQYPRGLGALLLVGGAYFAGTGLSGTIYLIDHGAAHKAGTFIAFLAAGLIGVGLGFLFRSEPGADEADARVQVRAPLPKTLGDWMKAQAAVQSPVKAETPVPEATSPVAQPTRKRWLSPNWKLVLVGASLSLAPFAMSLFARAMGLFASLFPHTNGRSEAQGLVFRTILISIVCVAVFFGIRNAGLRWNANDRRYMALYTLRGLTAVAIIFGVCALPWLLLSQMHLSEGDMMLIGWAGILWMPIVLMIGFAIGWQFVKLWKIKR